MSDLKFCPDCGAALTQGDRFCGECGFDINSMAQTPASQPTSARAVPPPTSQPYHQPQSYQQPQTPAAPSAAPGPTMGAGQTMLGRNYAPPGANTAGNKSALVIMVSLLAVLFLAGGGIYWWLSKDNPGKGTNKPAITQNNNTVPGTETQTAGNAQTAAPPQADLTRAATYLSEPGLKCTFFVNYPDGMSGIVDRISGRAVPNEAVRVSEVEVGIDMGEEYGFGFHYVERADGTYYIMDTSPFEIFPVLKNNMTAGQTWSYDTEYGSINYEVVDMGVDLDLGFAKFDDCLLLLEDNQAVGFQSITYYAPAKGSVYVIDPGGAFQYYKMTGMETIDQGQAANTIIKWCPNYQDIKDDRSQSY